MIQAHVQNILLIICISSSIAMDMQRWRTGPFLPNRAATQKTLMTWEIPEAYGEMGYMSSYFRYHFTELSGIHPKVPNSSFRKME